MWNQGDQAGDQPPRSLGIGHRKQGLWKASTRLGCLLGGQQPPPTVLDSFSQRQWQDLGSQPQAGEQKASMPKQLPAGRRPCGREGSWLCLPVHSQLWPGVLWGRAHPGKPLTFSRTVCSLDKSQRHPSYKGPIQRLPRPPAASSGGLDISFQSCRDLEDLQVIPPMTKSRKFPQNSAFIASMAVHTYNPRTHWLKQENWPKSAPIWATQ